jgi:hypothetical protein
MPAPNSFQAVARAKQPLPAASILEPAQIDADFNSDPCRLFAVLRRLGRQASTRPIRMQRRWTRLEANGRQPPRTAINLTVPKLDNKCDGWNGCGAVCGVPIGVAKIEGAVGKAVGSG